MTKRPTATARGAGPASTQCANALLSALTASDFKRLRRHLHPVEFQVRDYFFSANEPIESVYFLESGLASVVATSTAGESLEVGLIGREGMVGVPVILGDRLSPHDSFAQVAGHGFRMPADDLWQAMQKSWTLADVMLKFVSAFMVQITHSALANGRFNIEQRLARWLLVAHDRVGTDNLPLTHDFLGMMLGVRRAGVTEALHVLEGRGAVRSRRGNVVIRDREKLERIAGAAYGIPESGHARLRGAGARSDA